MRHPGLPRLLSPCDIDGRTQQRSQLEVWETAEAHGDAEPGIEVVGDMSWGSTFVFYETKGISRHLEFVCKAGLEGREFCLWGSWPSH